MALDTQIRIHNRYRKGDGAPERTPPMPEEVVVRVIDRGQIAFADVARPGSEYILNRDEFRAVYDDA